MSFVLSVLAFPPAQRVAALVERSVHGIGIIGAGGIVSNHAFAYRSLPELARLVAVADIDHARAAAAKREHNFDEAYTDYRALLLRDDIDVVSICTPPSSHTQILLDALSAGKHVLCEKPMACNLADADQTVRAAEVHPNQKLSFVYQYRADPTHNRVRELIRNGSLGRILMASVRVRTLRSAAYYAAGYCRGSWGVDGGGVLINQAIHQLDSLISFLGTPVEASASLKTFLRNIEAEDSLVGWVRFESGALATIECTVCAHEEGFAIDVIGENAQTTITGNPQDHSCQWQLNSNSSAVKRALFASGLRKTPDFPKEPRRSTIRAQKLACRLRGCTWLPPRHWAHTPLVEQFLSCIGSPQSVQVPASEARTSLELAIALYASALSGDPTRLPISCDHAFYGGINQLEDFVSASRALS